MKTWDQVVESAAEFIFFLEKGNFYNTKFSTEKDYKIISDTNLGIDYATNDSFDEWETVTDTPDIFPESFEWNDRIKYKLKQKKYFGFENQEFNGAKEKWITSEACLIVELMYRDIGIIFQCYAIPYLCFLTNCSLISFLALESATLTAVSFMSSICAISANSYSSTSRI